MSEQSIGQARASVMLYNNEKKQWEPSGGTQGVARVHVYHHTSNNTFRIVGRKANDHSVVINCAISRNLKYNQATPTFHQWRDQRQVYGLNFNSRDDAEAFSQAVAQAIEILNQNAGSQPRKTTQITVQQQSQSIPQQQQHAPQQQPQQQFQQPQQQQHFHQQPAQQSYQARTDIVVNGSRNTEQEEMMQRQQQQRAYEQEAHQEPQRQVISPQQPPPSPTPPSSGAPPPPPPPPAAPPAAPPAPPAAPPAPPAPAAPPAPPVPAAPPAPAPPPVGAPPPPPPPPPPSSNVSPVLAGGLAAQIAAAKLKKAQQQENEAEEPHPRSGSMSGARSMGGNDMMAEMQRKLAARRAKEEGRDSRDAGGVKPKEPVKEPEQERVAVSKFNMNSANNKAAPASKINIPNRTERSNSNTRLDQSPVSNDQLQELREVLVADFRKELEAVKEEILQAVREEIHKMR